MLMNPINASCHRKANRRVEFPIFYTSQIIHEINKLCTAAKNNYEPIYQKLKDDIQISIELDKPILIDSLSPNSPPSCFKYLRSFSPNHLPNQMDWKHFKASTNNLIARLFNFYFSSVYKTRNATFLPIIENPHMFLQGVKIDVSMVEALPSIASSNCSSSDSLPTLVFKSCPELLAPLVTKIFNTIIKSKQWPDFWKCSTIKSVLKSGNPENVENYRLISKLPQLSLTP